MQQGCKLAIRDLRVNEIVAGVAISKIVKKQIVVLNVGLSLVLRSSWCLLRISNFLSVSDIFRFEAPRGKRCSVDWVYGCLRLWQYLDIVFGDNVGV